MDDLDIYIRESMPVMSKKTVKKSRKISRSRAIHLRELKHQKMRSKRIVITDWVAIDECILQFITDFFMARNPFGYNINRNRFNVAFCQNTKHRLEVNVEYNQFIIISARVFFQPHLQPYKPIFHKIITVSPEDPTSFDSISDLLELTNAYYWLGKEGYIATIYGSILTALYHHIKKLIPVRLQPSSGESPEQLKYWKFTGTIRDGVLHWETDKGSTVCRIPIKKLVHPLKNVSDMVDTLLKWKKTAQKLKRRDQRRIHAGIR